MWEVPLFVLWVSIISDLQELKIEERTVDFLEMKKIEENRFLELKFDVLFVIYLFFFSQAYA